MTPQNSDYLVENLTLPQELRTAALYWLGVCEPAAKALGVSALRQAWQAGDVALAPATSLSEQAGMMNTSTSFTIPAAVSIPGRPTRPLLVPPRELKHRSMVTLEGRAALVHALAHIEFNAINLALDVIWRFADMPANFYTDWLKVADEEALHFSLLADHLQTLGFAYGDFPGHDSLWEMAQKTEDDILARMALVPRTLEARGLDATPAVRAKLAQAGDAAAAAILDIILRDEIGHVAIGNHWYAWLCQQRGLDPLATYAALAQQYKAPPLRGPFNLSARRLAGFTEEELASLTS